MGVPAMKILVVCQYYYPEPFRITDICETLVSEGHELTVLTGLPNYPEGRILDDYRRGRRRKETINGVQVIRSFEIGRGQSKARGRQTGAAAPSQLPAGTSCSDDVAVRQDDVPHQRKRGAGFSE